MPNESLSRLGRALSESAFIDNRAKRRAGEHSATRASILDAARRVGMRDGAKNLSLRAVAAEAGFAPAALYGYFRNKDELLLALAAEDLSALSRAMRDAASKVGAKGRLGAAAAAALTLLERTETFATAPSALSGGGEPSEAERFFNGRMIAAMKTLSDAAGNGVADRSAQADIVLIAAALAGLAVFSRSGRLATLGFSSEEILTRLDARFSDSK